MPYTKIQIISLALIEIGKRPINSIEEGGSLGASVDLLYDVKLKTLLAAYSWRFATTQKQLSKLSQSPLKDWGNAFNLPADYLTAIDVIPHSDYEIYENYIYSNSNELYLEYRFLVDSSKLPEYFIEFFKLELALSLARFATVKQEVFASLLQAKKDMFFIATSIDSQARPNTIITQSTLKTVRY